MFVDDGRCACGDALLGSARCHVPSPDAIARTLAELFAADPGRAERYVVHAGDLRIDYSKQPIDDDVLDGAARPARRRPASQPRRDAMFAGEQINVTEDRAVLHTALRRPPAP